MGKMQNQRKKERANRVDVLKPELTVASWNLIPLRKLGGTRASPSGGERAETLTLSPVHRCLRAVSRACPPPCIKAKFLPEPQRVLRQKEAGAGSHEVSKSPSVGIQAKPTCSLLHYLSRNSLKQSLHQPTTRRTPCPEETAGCFLLIGDTKSG